jgi:hypothetical protein
LGRGFSTTGGGCGGGVGAADGAGVLSGGVEFRFLLAGSEREALAGSFLFLSMFLKEFKYLWKFPIQTI